MAVKTLDEVRKGFHVKVVHDRRHVESHLINSHKQVFESEKIPYVITHTFDGPCKECEFFGEGLLTYGRRV